MDEARCFYRRRNFWVGTFSSKSWGTQVGDSGGGVPLQLHYFPARRAGCARRVSKPQKNTISGIDVFKAGSAHCHGPIFEGVPISGRSSAIGPPERRPQAGPESSVVQTWNMLFSSRKTACSTFQKVKYDVFPEENSMFHFSNGGTCCSPRGKQHISLFETAWDFMKFMKFEALSTTPMLALRSAARGWDFLRILNF